MFVHACMACTHAMHSYHACHAHVQTFTGKREGAAGGTLLRGMEEAAGTGIFAGND